MKTNTQNDPQSTAPPTQTITRRSFIKRTSSAALVAILAVGAFQTEALAQQSTSPKVDSVMEFTVLQNFSVEVLPNLKSWANGNPPSDTGGANTGPITYSVKIFAPGSPCFVVLSPANLVERSVSVPGHPDRVYLDFIKDMVVKIKFRNPN